MAESTVPNKVIKTKRLILREARQYDIGAMYALYSNKLVMQFWAPPFDSVARTQEYLTAMITSPCNGILAFMIVLPHSAPTPPTSASASRQPTTTAVDEGKLIGHAGIWMPNTDNELVFMIDNTDWNQGYISEVLEALIPIFWKKGLKVVHADVEPENEASLWLLRKMGFGQAGGGIVESSRGRCETLRMELRKPGGKEGEKGERGEEGGEEEDDDDSDGDDDDGVSGG